MENEIHKKPVEEKEQDKKSHILHLFMHARFSNQAVPFADLNNNVKENRATSKHIR